VRNPAVKVALVVVLLVLGVLTWSEFTSEVRWVGGRDVKVVIRMAEPFPIKRVQYGGDIDTFRGPTPEQLEFVTKLYETDTTGLKEARLARNEAWITFRRFGRHSEFRIRLDKENEDRFHLVRIEFEGRKPFVGLVQNPQSGNPDTAVLDIAAEERRPAALNPND
jgi:hypothetical protein